ncbi:MAG: hypothetical protein EPO21_19475 [Chloroflexota bacterium]|nr:MAG: hypothetical protein EPO21_19475 [Chloroflexota bacterium]
MKKEFIVERDGKSFVLFAGLLDEAHQQGLRRIETRLIQIPSEENGQTAVCQATVETERGVFSGLGDASPFNSNRAMQRCLIRLAETRAKARALRDAVNVGVVAFEELSGEEDFVGPGPAEERTYTRSMPTPNTFDDERPSAGMSATAAQIKAIYSIGKNERQLTVGDVDELAQKEFGQVPNKLTKRQASEFIDRLKTRH